VERGARLFRVHDAALAREALRRGRCDHEPKWNLEAYQFLIPRFWPDVVESFSSRS